MKIAVMGAGAVGCYFGGMLARAGHDVVLIGRSHHADAIRRDGLLLDTQSFHERVRVEAATDASAAKGATHVLFCAKSIDIEHAAAAIAPQLERNALVLSLQNGVDSAERLQAALTQRVVPTVVYVGVEMAGPGHVKHHGRGELTIGSSEASAGIVALFARAGVAVHVSDNVLGALWIKMIVNCAYNALSALSQLPYGRLVQGDGVLAIMRDVVDECLAVARASGANVTDDAWEAVEHVARTLSGQYSSTAQDLARGKRTEIDHLNGYIVRRGTELGVPTPANRVLHTLVKLVETNPRDATSG